MDCRLPIAERRLRQNLNCESRIPNFRSLILVGFCAVLLLSSTGCSLLGIAAYKFQGPVKHPPAYVLPVEPTIVIVDRPVNFGAVSLNAQRIGSSVTEQLRASKMVIGTVLDSGLAVDRRTRLAADGSRPKATQIAADCGATQLIYIELSNYESSQSVGGEAIDGSVDASVWVVDVASGQVTWPGEANQGHPVSHKIPFTPVTGHVSEESLRAQMDAALADKIGRLFTGWVEE
jgi:hypothetical protein